MTTKAELLEQIAELQAKIDAMPDDRPTIQCGRAYEPLEVGQKYWRILSGKCADFEWVGNAFDKIRLESASIFLTEKAAQTELRKRKLWHNCSKAMRDAWKAHGEAPDWTNPNQKKYVIFLFNGKEKTGRSYLQFERIHFPTEKSRNAWRSTATDDDIKLMLMEQF